MKIPTAVTINNAAISVKEWNGKRVVTLKDIDTVHGRQKETARKRFNQNRKHFVEGVDYFVLKTDEAKKEFNISAPNGLILLTETGYLMLVKSFRDDLAWDVQRQLVNTYFTVQHFRQIPPEPSNLTDAEILGIAERAKEKKRMMELEQYHQMKAGVLIKQAEYEMKQIGLLQFVREHPWLAEADNALRLEEKP